MPEVPKFIPVLIVFSRIFHVYLTFTCFFPSIYPEQIQHNAYRHYWNIYLIIFCFKICTSVRKIALVYRHIARCKFFADAFAVVRYYDCIWSVFDEWRALRSMTLYILFFEKRKIIRLTQTHIISWWCGGVGFIYKFSSGGCDIIICSGCTARTLQRSMLKTRYLYYIIYYIRISELCELFYSVSLSNFMPSRNPKRSEY